MSAKFNFAQMYIVGFNSLRATLFVFVLLSALIALSNVVQAGELHGKLNCLTVLETGREVESLRNPTSRLLLRELADLRAEIDRATFDKSVSVARVLARNFDEKLNEAIQLGIDPGQLKEFMIHRRGGVLDDAADEQRRREKASDAEKGSRIWREVNKINLGPFRGLLVVSPDGSTIATRNNDGIQLSGLPEGKPIAEIQGVHIAVVRFSPDSQELMTLDGATGRLQNAEEGIVSVWSTKTGQLIRQLKGQTSTVYSGAYSHDGKMIATLAKDQSYAIWNVATGALIHRQMIGSSSEEVMFTPDDKFLALRSGSRVDIIETGSGRIVHKLQMAAALKLMDLRQDGVWIADESGEISHFRYTDFERDYRLKIDVAERLTFVEISKDGSRLIAIDRQLAGGVWDMTTKLPMPNLVTKDLGNMKFTPDGTQIFQAAIWGEFSKDKPTGVPSKIFDAKTGQIVGVLSGLDTTPTFRFAPNGQALLTMSIGASEIKVWKPLPGTEP